MSIDAFGDQEWVCVIRGVTLGSMWQKWPHKGWALTGREINEDITSRWCSRQELSSSSLRVWSHLSEWMNLVQLDFIMLILCLLQGVLEKSSLPWGSAGKESICNVGELGSILRWGRSPGGRNGNPLQYSGLENPMDRGTWWATVHGIAKSWTQLSD